MPKLPTRLVQRSSEPLADVEPLTLPIYETTTYVFDSAAQVRGYNEGKTTRYLYSRYENPTIVAVEQTLAALEGADAAAAAVERSGGDDDRAAGAGVGGRRGGVQRRDLRRHAAPADRGLRPARRGGAVRAGRGVRDRLRQLLSDKHARPLVRVADQSDAALHRHRRGGGARAARAASPRSSTTPSPVPSTSSRSRSASTS